MKCNKLRLVSLRDLASSQNGYNCAGFTLIELMIVITIMIILAMVAIPNYNSTVTKSARAEARSTLYQIAQLQERFFTTNNTYLCFNATGCTTTPTGWKNYSGSSYAKRKYAINTTARSGTLSCAGDTVTNTIANSFVITATPANGFADTECGSLTLDNCGITGNSVTSATNCWK
jgi:type IV pilus assembly protein PilE